MHDRKGSMHADSIPMDKKNLISEHQRHGNRELNNVLFGLNGKQSSGARNHGPVAVGSGNVYGQDMPSISIGGTPVKGTPSKFK